MPLSEAGTQKRACDGGCGNGRGHCDGREPQNRERRRTVMRLADSLGDFVVASAGPHLESVIAGRGAGAAALSEARRSTVLNIDIGGRDFQLCCISCRAGH